MHQHLKDLIWFCCKQEETTYEELFCETVEAEKEKVPEVKITSLKTKSAIAEPVSVGKDSTGIQDLKQKIDALMTVVKSSTFGGARPKQSGNGATPQKGKDNGKVNGNPYKGWGPVKPLLDHSSQDRNTSIVTIVGGGDIVINNVLAREHQLKDTFKPKQGSK